MIARDIPPDSLLKMLKFIFASGFEGSKQNPVRLEEILAGPPSFRINQANPEGHWREVFNTPFVSDTLSRLFTGEHTVGMEMNPAYFGHVVRGKPRDVYVDMRNYYHGEGKDSRAINQRTSESTLAHELTHSDQFSGDFRIPLDLRKKVATEWWRRNPKALERAQRFVTTRNKPPEYFGGTEYMYWLENTEAVADAFAGAMNLFRNKNTTPEQVTSSEEITPGVRLMYDFLKSQIQ